MTETKPSSSNVTTVYVCQGTGCVSGKAIEISQALEKAAAELNLPGVKIDVTGCHGFCEQGPVAIVEPEGIFYTHVGIDDTCEIIDSHIRDGQPL